LELKARKQNEINNFDEQIKTLSKEIQQKSVFMEVVVSDS
jgi:hypothetical protein